MTLIAEKNVKHARAKNSGRAHFSVHPSPNSGRAQVRRLNLWVEQRARQHTTSLHKKFVPTKVARDQLAVARRLRENATMGLVVGPTGTGKTRCALAIHDKYVGSIYIRIITGYHHPRGLAGALAEKLNVRRRVTLNSEKDHHSQLERAIAALRNSNRLLILDEAGKLTTPALELLRDIHDECGLPVLLIATRDLHDRILKNADPDHGQLYSRFDVTHYLTEGRDMYSGKGKALYTVDDIKALYNEPPVRLSPDGVQYLHEVANMLGYGSLRRCEIRLCNGARRARKCQGVGEGEKVTVTADYLPLRCAQDRLLTLWSPSEQETVIDRRRRAAAISG